MDPFISSSVIRDTTNGERVQCDVSWSDIEFKILDCRRKRKTATIDITNILQSIAPTIEILWITFDKRIFNMRAVLDVKRDDRLVRSEVAHPNNAYSRCHNIHERLTIDCRRDSVDLLMERANYILIRYRATALYSHILARLPMRAYLPPALEGILRGDVASPVPQSLQDEMASCPTCAHILERTIFDESMTVTVICPKCNKCAVCEHQNGSANCSRCSLHLVEMDARVRYAHLSKAELQAIVPGVRKSLTKNELIYWIARLGR